ncbi:MAG TPA: hypothetical protein VL742_17950 [Casimicrobiaceae bacterium]|nr:hypothetical protein [Casimicrobiaceae bacterium]
MRSDQRKAPADASSSQHPRSGTSARRRNFLLALGASGAGAATLAARSLTGTAPQSDAAVDGNASKGYQLTDHVRRYYGTAKL